MSKSLTQASLYKYESEYFLSEFYFLMSYFRIVHVRYCHLVSEVRDAFV